MDENFYQETDEQRLARLKKIQRGDWIFTCGLKPLQFKAWDDPKKMSDYDESWKERPQVERELFFWYDYFTTMEGSHHSTSHCSCWQVSEKYALWFMEHVAPIAKNLWDGQDELMDYHELVEQIANEHGIKFEGA